MQMFVQNMLDLRILSNGALDCAKTVFKPSKVVLKVINLFKAKAQKQNINLVFRVDNSRLSEPESSHKRLLLTPSESTANLCGIMSSNSFNLL